ncbi:MAG: AAA family ATPase [Hungatella sp.]|nr:AAA family ATPase [Hungatella sp.]
MKKIAIYGKGGIGKSTTVSNLSAALAAKGYKVMQIGCDPKADSTRNLTGGKKIPTVLELLRDKENLVLKDLVHEGDQGVLCVEAGGPVPGIGCAGRGIITAFEKLEELEAFSVYQPDIVIYDVLGDVVCGGFAMPIRGGYAEEVYIVSSGEMMSLYAANNIASAVKMFGKRKYASLRGIILNSKNIENEEALVEQAAREIETQVVFQIPRNPLIQQAEALGKTVVSAFPDSEMAKNYEKLGDLIFS